MAREKENTAQRDAQPSWTMNGSPSATWTNSWAACKDQGKGRANRWSMIQSVIAPRGFG